jgi:tRNA U34 5-carboxymethylaminomethyl modifying GTPase MnmE/TrmE
MSASFDTLQSAKRLREVGFDEPQAEALTGLLRDVQQTEREPFATKIDLDMLDGKIERAVAELDAKIERVAAELEAKIERVAAELDAKIERLEAKIDHVAAELRAEFALMRSEMEILRRGLTIRLGSMIVVATGLLLAPKFFK